MNGSLSGHHVLVGVSRQYQSASGRRINQDLAFGHHPPPAPLQGLTTANVTNSHEETLPISTVILHFISFVVDRDSSRQLARYGENFARKGSPSAAVHTLYAAAAGLRIYCQIPTLRCRISGPAIDSGPISAWLSGVTPDVDREHSELRVFLVVHD